MKIASRLGLVALQLTIGLALVNRVGFAADEDKFLGTWALNAGQSKAPGGAGGLPTNATVVVTKAGSGMYKSVSDTTMSGISAHSEITFATDGKDYAPVVTPAPPPGAASITQSFERVSATAYKGSIKLNGQVIATTMNEVSTDGKTFTITTTGVGPAAGVVATMVFDRK
jgi:hypothetical protein